VRPYLIDWVFHGHHFQPPSYGVLLALAFTVAYIEAIRRTVRLEEDPRHMEWIFLIILVSSIFGSRAFHVAFEDLGYYLIHPDKILAVWEGGYTFYGAMIAAIFALYLYCCARGIDFLHYTDIVAPATMLGLAIGRIGCFLAGCCWGKPTEMPWGVVFTHPHAFSSTKGIPLHPTQLYESAAAFTLYLYLCFRFKNREYPGQIFFHTLLGYAAFRFVIEFFRGDDYRGFVFNGVFSYSQLVSLTLVPFGILGILLYARPRRVHG